MPVTPEVTQLLVAWRDGDQAALEQLTPLVYAELHRLVRGYMRRENPGHTLQASALVNEAFARLIEHPQIDWQNRAHFFGIAAQMMRHILLDYARGQARAKRGGGVLLEAALERPPTACAAFLDEACVGDETLRQEVESLLRSDEAAESFREAAAVTLAAAVMAAQQAQPLPVQFPLRPPVSVVEGAFCTTTLKSL